MLVLRKTLLLPRDNNQTHTETTPGQDNRVDTKLISKRDVFKPDPWSPPAEALNKSQYRLLIRASNRQNKPKKKMQRQTATEPSQKPYRAITIKPALLSLQTHTDRTSPLVTTTQQLMKDLYTYQARTPRHHQVQQIREGCGSVVECLTRDLGATGSSLTGVTALWSLSKTHKSKLSTGSTQEDRSPFN